MSVTVCLIFNSSVISQKEKQHARVLFFAIFLYPGCGQAKGLTAARRAERKLAGSKVAEKRVWH